MTDFVAPLPDPGTPVLFVGCGTSYYIGEAYARDELVGPRAHPGRRRLRDPLPRPGGNPGRPLPLGNHHRRRPRHRPTARHCSRRRNRRRDRHSGRGEVPTAGASRPRRRAIGRADPVRHHRTPRPSGIAWATTCQDCRRRRNGALTDPLPEQDPRHLVFLGTDWTIGVAHEAALKCREAAGAWTEAYPVMEYQHGPISVAGPGSLIWSFSPLPDFVRSAIEATGCHRLRTRPRPVGAVGVGPSTGPAARGGGRPGPGSPRFLNRAVELD